MLCPGLVSPGAAAWQRIRESGVPLALVGNDIAEAPRLTCVTNDSVRAGRLAAELLAKMARGKPAAVIVGSRNLADHAEKLRGFEEAAGELGLPLAEVCQSHDDPATSYRLAERLLDEHPGLGGLYIGTDNGAEVCRCVWERGLTGKLAVVATGTFPRSASTCGRRWCNSRSSRTCPGRARWSSRCWPGTCWTAGCRRP